MPKRNLKDDMEWNILPFVKINTNKLTKSEVLGELPTFQDIEYIWEWETKISNPYSIHNERRSYENL